MVENFKRINKAIPAEPLFVETKKIPYSACQLQIREIGVKLACELNEKWHSRLPKIHWSNVVRSTSYICFAAEYESYYYAVAIWSSPVATFNDSKHILELRRFAICGEAPKNTGSRMMGKMVKEIKSRFKEIDKLISYQDTEVHLGTIYKASNWRIGGITRGVSWTTRNRKRNKEQTLAKKIRWEYFVGNRLSEKTNYGRVNEDT